MLLVRSINLFLVMSLNFHFLGNQWLTSNDNQFSLLITSTNQFLGIENLVTLYFIFPLLSQNLPVSLEECLSWYSTIIHSSVKSMGFAYVCICDAALAPPLLVSSIDLFWVPGSIPSFNFDFLGNQWPNSHDNQFLAQLLN